MTFHEMFIKKMQYFGSGAMENKKRNRKQNHTVQTHLRRIQSLQAQTLLYIIFSKCLQIRRFFWP